MFIRKIKTPQGTDYFHLVESYRENGKVRQRTLLPLGQTKDGRLENLMSAVKRHSDFMTASEMAKNLSVEKTFILGPLLILEKLFEKLGINKTLEELPKNQKTAIDIKKILFALTAGRFINPGSKLKVFERQQKAFYPGLFKPDIKLHQIYRTLDFLAKHKDQIEKSLYWHGRNLFNLQVDVVLYDLTTLRFESRRTDLGQLRQFGYSKEKRGDLVQCVLGLLVDREGLPLGFEVYPGNTFEGKTVSDIEKKLREKFNVRRFIFVGDRGLFSKKNLQVLSKGEGEFILGMKLGSINSRHQEFYDKSRFQEISPGLSVYETKYEGQRLIITWSAKRAERDRKAREEILLKIEKKLKKRASSSGKHFITNEAYQKYVCLKGEGEAVLNQKAIEKEALKDGFFGVVTNVRDMSGSNFVSCYKELWRVEEAFGELKGTLKARPVFHWTDRRITGHLVMCFIAYLCEAYLTRELRKKGSLLKSAGIEGGSIGPRPLTVVEGMRDLCEIRAIPVEIRGRVIWVRTQIEGNGLEMFRALGVRVPPKLLKVCEGKEVKPVKS